MGISKTYTTEVSLAVDDNSDTVITGINSSATQLAATSFLSGPPGAPGAPGAPGSSGSVPGSYNVESYGALGNGVHDDTDAIKAAITAALTNTSGGTILFPPGNFLISSALPAHPHLYFLGSGSGVADGSGGGEGIAITTITQSSTSANCISGTDVYDFGVSHLTLAGPGSGTGIGIMLALSVDGDSRYITLQDIAVQNFGSDGIKIDTLIVSHFDEVISYGNGGYGFNLLATTGSGAAATSFTATSCWAHANALAGWNINKMVYSSFVACASDINGQQGYLITNCQSVGFYSCGAESNTGNPYKVQGASYNVTAVSCWCFHNSTIGFYVTGSSQSVSIIGFHENTPTGSPTASIQVDTGSTCTITGHFVITATNFAAGTTTVLNDGSGNAAIAGNLTTGGSAAVSGSVLAYKSGVTALFKATDSANGGNISMSQIASGNGTIESTSAVSIVADSGSNAILSATNPQLLIQHLGGSFHNMQLGHDDTDGHIGTNAGSLFLAPSSTLVLPSVNLSHSLGNASFYWAALFSQVLNLNSTASISGSSAGVLAVTGSIHATSPVFVTPNLGVPSAISLANATNTTLPIAAINATGTANSTTYLRGDGSWQTISAGLTNPMTTAGDIIYGGASGTPTRLAIGSSTSLLMGGASAPVWTAATGTGSPVLATSPSLTTPAIGVATGVSLALTNTSASGLAVGANGTTNPVLLVDSSTASVATGVSIKGAAAGSGVVVSAISSGTNENLGLAGKGTGGIIIQSGLQINDAVNIVVGSTSGTKIGTATTQKLGFFGVTAVVQSGATTDLGTVLSNLGLRASGTAYPITTSGTVTLTGTVALAGATITNTGTLTLPTSTDTIIGRATTDTLTNKRVTKRSGTTTSSATPTINTDNTDIYTLTAMAAAVTSMTTNLSGTPNVGDELLIGFKDNGTARAITWGTSFVSSGVATLLATTVISKQHWVKLMWDGAHWACMAVDATGY